MIRDALEPLASGQIGRYDEDFEVRAFGDNLTLWGTPVVLIETGGFTRRPIPIRRWCGSISSPSCRPSMRWPPATWTKRDARRYETLPKNESKEFYVLVKNATVVSGTGVPPFIGDIGINAVRRVRTIDGRRQIQLQATINDLGDLRTIRRAAHDRREPASWPRRCSDAVLKEGQEITLPDWVAAPAAQHRSLPAAARRDRPDASARRRRPSRRPLSQSKPF